MAHFDKKAGKVIGQTVNFNHIEEIIPDIQRSVHEPAFGQDWRSGWR
ncbi:hypothetical protein LX87_05210 [Larkinella arboricola]|uniref:Uncharacterized protein n=1 Tax=Larkinella arboricola TaxID=643671 RepID=A0A327WNY5_LARAB|nr:hypothetical protein LX87_05210 [Larkinella arboricola]